MLFSATICCLKKPTTRCMLIKLLVKANFAYVFDPTSFGCLEEKMAAPRPPIAVKKPREDKPW